MDRSDGVRPRRDTTVELDDDPSKKVVIKQRTQAAQEVFFGGESEYLKTNIDPPRRTLIQEIAHHPNAVMINNPIAFLAIGGGIGVICMLMVFQSSRNSLPYEAACLSFLVQSALVGVVLHHAEQNLIHNEKVFLQEHIQKLQEQSKTQDAVSRITMGSVSSISPRRADTESTEGNVTLEEGINPFVDISVEEHGIDTDPPGRTFMQNIARNPHTVMINNPIALLAVGGGIGAIGVLMASLASQSGLSYGIEITSLLFLVGTALVGFVLQHVDNNLTGQEMSALRRQFQQLKEGFKTQFEQRKDEMFFSTLESESASEEGDGDTNESSGVDEENPVSPIEVKGISSKVARMANRDVECRFL